MLKRLVNLTIAGLLFIATAVAIVPAVTSAQAVPGNNGTLKVHEQGTPSGTEDNDPKVCVFNFEGFGFDAEQEGYVVIATQGGPDGGMGVKQLDFGPTNGDGYAQTAYVDDLEEGLYKATLYGKDNEGQINLEDEKAKSKNFKVECEAPEVLEASASVAVTPANCEVGERLVYDVNAWVNATLGGGSTASGQTGPANYTVTAQAVTDAMFMTESGTISEDKKSQTFTGSLEGKVTGPECVLGETPEKPVTPAGAGAVAATADVPEVLPATSSNGAVVSVLAGLTALLTLVGYAVRLSLSRGL